MADTLQKNAERFMGFANTYDQARPTSPMKAQDILRKYLGKDPELVVDLGCGTGLSTFIWDGVSKQVVGLDPSEDMLQIAKQKAIGKEHITFQTAYSDNTGLGDATVDIVTCSQSFHWMDPVKTLQEVSRILKDGGIFAAYDCDWPPVVNWKAEKEYNQLFDKVREFEKTRPELANTFTSWPKEKHLERMNDSGKFRYVREIVFSNTEICDAERFIKIALSQGGLQSILKLGLVEFLPYVSTFQDRVRSILGIEKFAIEFGYRMRLGVK